MKFCAECGTAVGVHSARHSKRSPDEQARLEEEARQALAEARRALEEVEALKAMEVPAPPTPLPHNEQVSILESAIADFAKHGWHEWTARPTPYSVSLRRKSGLMARQFMTVWVEDDGSVWMTYVGEGGSLRALPDAFRREAPMHPELVKPAPAPGSTTSAASAAAPLAAPESGKAFRKAKRSRHK
jgi:hypothetical protein